MPWLLVTSGRDSSLKSQRAIGNLGVRRPVGDGDDDDDNPDYYADPERAIVRRHETLLQQVQGSLPRGGITNPDEGIVFGAEGNYTVPQMGARGQPIRRPTLPQPPRPPRAAEVAEIDVHDYQNLTVHGVPIRDYQNLQPNTLPPRGEINPPVARPLDPYDFLREPWFFGQMTQEKADDILKNNRPQSYLVRVSSRATNPGPNLVLSCRECIPRQVVKHGLAHVPIHYEDTPAGPRFSLKHIPGAERTFPTATLLIEFYQKENSLVWLRYMAAR